MTLIQTNPAQTNAKVDRILVVDDVPDNLFLIKAILEEEAYDISLLEDGASALAQIEQSPPDLLLLDVMMPGIDGYEVTRRVRQNPKLPFIPILLITAHDRSSVVEGLDAGADDFVRKPVEVDELLARVRSLLRLKHSIDEREQMVRQREDFISRLTHDLRTPLVAADRMLTLFRQGAFCEVTSAMDEALASMVRSNQNLLQMVNTLLEVHRHEAGYKNLTFLPCQLQEIIREVAQELRPLAEEKGLALNVEMADKVSAVMGDRLELRRVLTNLIGNAIKFTDSGSINVRLSQVPSSSPPKNGRQPDSWVVVEVEDTGPGIAPEDQTTLFDRFRQGKHKRAGSGLGLYLSRRIIEAHWGRIRVRSKVGQGSAFAVYLPV